LSPAPTCTKCQKCGTPTCDCCAVALVALGRCEDCVERLRERARAFARTGVSRFKKSEASK